MKAPFTWFGGKRLIAGEIWAALGDVPNYVEPFAGSLAVLLERPHHPGVETVNDADGLLCNAWRALRAAPEEVAGIADWPVSELDLHARHLRLVAQRQELTERLVADPDYYDARLAGWWIWGACCWIGSGWCAGTGPWGLVEGRLAHLGNAGRGVHRQLPHLGDAGRGVHRQLPHLGDAGQGVHRVGVGSRGDHLRDYFGALAARLERVRIACGDWQRVCTPAVTTCHGLTGVLLDPPYRIEGSRTDGLYAIDGEVSDQVARWAWDHGDDPLCRIVLCGYEGDYQPPPGWRTVPWKANGGYGSQGDGVGLENSGRERLYLSPHCLGGGPVRQASLFGGGA